MSAMNTALMFSKASDEWETPQDFFAALDREFAFTWDCAATAANRKCDHYFGPDQVFEWCSDALTAQWASHGNAHRARAGVEIRFLKGRLTFGGAPAGAPFPSVVVVFRPVTA